MQYMAVHHFALPSLPIMIRSSNNSHFGKLFRRTRSTFYPIRCSVVNSSTNTTIVRRSANYEPPIWSFDYIQSLSSQFKGEPYISRLNELEGDVKRMLIEMENSLAQLELIDTLQRLGLSHRFKSEINTILKEKYTNFNNIINNTNFNLYATALEFRLLRQYGYAVPQEIFNVFKDERMKFKTRLGDDIVGVLALYEASFYGKKGESILEEARVFSTQCLKNYTVMMMEQNNLLDDNNNYNMELVDHALELPLHWRITRSEAKWFIGVYERRQDMNCILLEFAKLDYNMVQSIYQEDLKHLSGWWGQSKLAEKMDFFRDRLVECFLWTLGVTWEPELSYYRRISGRLYVLITTIDDIYDVYGTLEELELFTNAVERWNVKAINDLPDYMKMPFFLLYNTINEMAFDVLKEQNFINIQYLKKTWVDFCKHQLQEAKWFYSGYKPTFQEYIDNAWISVSGPIILVHAYFFFTNPITKKDALKFLEVGYPNIIYQASIILRLADDLGTSPDEMKRGDIPKSIQCYMHDTGASEDEAREHIKFLINEAWKEMNNEDDDNCCFSKEFVEACKNLGRISQFIYQYGDGHASQDSLSKQRISELIIDHISL